MPFMDYGSQKIADALLKFGNRLMLEIRDPEENQEILKSTLTDLKNRKSILNYEIINQTLYETGMEYNILIEARKNHSFYIHIDRCNTYIY